MSKNTIRPLIAGNWKMNASRKSAAKEVKRLVRYLKSTKTPAIKRPMDIVIAPPFPLLDTVADLIRWQRIGLGAQDCHIAESGAHTGDVSAEMVAEAGCDYCIVGHSERRADHGEDNKTVRKKAEAAHRAGLTAIVCVGETREEREAGAANKVVGKQLRESVPAGATKNNTVIAYEPVWAIGTGLTPTEKDIASMHAMLRQRLSKRFAKDGEGMRLLYGGSVKPANAAAILAIENVNGALVGGASLTGKDFWGIIRES